MAQKRRRTVYTQDHVVRDVGRESAPRPDDDIPAPAHFDGFAWTLPDLARVDVWNGTGAKLSAFRHLRVMHPTASQLLELRDYIKALRRHGHTVRVQVNNDPEASIPPMLAAVLK